MNIFKVACFTGHRSQKLPWGFNEKDKRCKAMKTTLRLEVEKAIQRDYKTFLCGMAIGFDIICAKIVLNFKKKYKDIKIIGALPCATQAIYWSIKDKKHYGKLLKKLDGIRCINNEYTGVECILERNRYMVNNSSLIIALFNGALGGTKYTVDYAMEMGREIIIIEP